MSELLFAEDVLPGTEVDLGDYTVSLEEILEFSRQWDPQGFHVEQSTAGYFGGTIASGLHSMAILQRLSVLGAYSGWAIIAGRRIADVRFLAPTRAGMTLHGSFVVDAVEMRDAQKALVTVSKRLVSGEVLILTAVHEFYMYRRT